MPPLVDESLLVFFYVACGRLRSPGSNETNAWLVVGTKHGLHYECVNLADSRQMRISVSDILAIKPGKKWTIIQKEFLRILRRNKPLEGNYRHKNKNCAHALEI